MTSCSNAFVVLVFTLCHGVLTSSSLEAMTARFPECVANKDDHHKFLIKTYDSYTLCPLHTLR